MHWSGPLFSLLLAGLLVACGPITNETFEYEDEGDLCFSSDPWGGGDRTTLKADEPFELTVVFNSCLSSGCTDFHETSCSIDRSGETLTIASQGSYTDTSGGMSACTDDCAASSATCEGPALEEGTYTFVHGDDTYEVEVPGSEEEPGCLS